MISSLSIKNYALIKNMEIGLEKGFNVLIGETGAGKSIILSSIHFVLGGKSDKTVISSGEDFTKVSIVFTSIQDSTNSVLKDLGFELSDELILSRVLRLDGKNECRINGEIATLVMLKIIAETLVDSYYQNEGVEILKVKNHLRMLDSYAPLMLVSFKSEIAIYKERLTSIDRSLNELGGNFENREREMDLLKYQLNEIDEVNIQDGEEEEIVEKLKIMNNSEKIISSIDSAQMLLSENSNACLTSLKYALSEIAQLSNLDNQFASIYERLNSARYELEDIADFISDYKSKCFYDEKQLTQLDNRLDRIKALKKKYGATLNKINEFYQSSKQRLEQLSNAEENILKLTNERASVAKKLYEQCQQLSTKRRSVAKEIEQKICIELETLGMKNARFIVHFNDAPLFTEKFNCSLEGYDDIEFMFSANLGQELKSIAKTISGGEMSRFMLALKNIIVDKDGIATLILDEVDSGISGDIGSRVAEKIASIAVNKQILCITHLPQVTAMADNYYFVYKEIENDKTRTNVRMLNDEEQINYLAKLSSPSLTPSAISNAKELKQWGNNYKNLHKLNNR